METPKYLQILWNYKWLLAFGLVVAIVAGFFAGFSVSGGQIYSRAQQSWLASTTVLVDSGRSTLYQSEIYAPVPTADAPAPEVITQDLADLAQIYAYLAASEVVQDRVEDEIGPLDELESITAVSRTTQPSGNEQFPGRLSLPVLDIVGVAATPNRAELISQTANDVFQAYIVEQQDAQELTEDVRVRLTTLEEKAAIEGQGSNPVIPIVIAAGGTFLAFVALAYILFGIRSGRRPRPRRSNGDDNGRSTPDDTGSERSALPAGEADWRPSALPAEETAWPPATVPAQDTGWRLSPLTGEETWQPSTPPAHEPGWQPSARPADDAGWQR